MCSHCRKASPDNSNIRRHIIGCGEGNASLVKKRAKFELIDDDSAEKTVTTETTSPHGIVYDAFENDDADDARIDWLFQDCNRSLLWTILEEPDITKLPAKLLRCLWGKQAPPEFQSIVLVKGGKVHCIGQEPVQLSRDVVCDIAAWILEFLYSVAKYSVPMRVPELKDVARDCFQRLCETREIDSDMTLRDALKRKKRTAGVRAAVAKMREVFI